MALFEHYRRGAGRRARTAATFMLLSALVWLCYAMLVYGNSRLDRLLGSDSPFWSKVLFAKGGALTEWLTPSFIVAVIVFAAGLVVLRAFVNKPRVADLLIETEAELRRVKWAP